MKQIFARHAWLGPGRFAENVLIHFDSHIRNITYLNNERAAPPDAEPVQWLTPGFVNAHCHLEYSWLGDQSRQMPRGRIPFGEWMAAIVSAYPKSSDDEAARDAAMNQAVASLISGGCTAVIDSTTDGSSGQYLARHGLPHFLFHEVLGLTQQRAEPLWNAAAARIKSIDALHDPALIGQGLNPHAPYSVGPWLRQQLTAARPNIPQAWHLAETPDEDALFQSATGSIAHFLRQRDMTFPTSDRLNGAFDFLRESGLLDQCSIAFHGNTLSTDQAKFFTAERAIVHCPGTHQWFKRDKLPLKQWLDAGVNICLGTDSLASSDSLSMLEMIAITLRTNSELSADDVLKMACTNPGELPFLSAIEYKNEIQMGERTNFLSINLDSAGNWIDILTNNKATVESVWINGKSYLIQQYEAR